MLSGERSLEEQESLAKTGGREKDEVGKMDFPAPVVRRGGGGRRVSSSTSLDTQVKERGRQGRMESQGHEPVEVRARPYPAALVVAASQGPALHSAWPVPDSGPGGCPAIPGAQDQLEPGSVGPALADPQLCIGFALALWLPGPPASLVPAESRKQNSWTEAEAACALGGLGVGRL